MQLQLALDLFRLEDALSMAERVRDYIDIIEIGTPLIVESGMDAVRQFRAKFPDKTILADTKIVDAGALEASAAFEAGADYATVLAVADQATLTECLEVARHCQKKIVADLICVQDIPKKVAELESIGIDGIAVHTGVDQQKCGRTPMGDLKLVKEYSKRAAIFVAGGISLATVSDYASLRPEVLIVGGGICKAAIPEQEAKLFYETLQDVKQRMQRGSER